MTIRKHLAGIQIVLTILVVAIPLTLFITTYSLGFWSWVEHTFEIEAIGHSGPATWCYLVTYVVVVVAGGFLSWLFMRRRNDRQSQ